MATPVLRWDSQKPTFRYLPMFCLYSMLSAVVAELKGEIAALQAEVLELRSALKLANKKIEDATTAQDSAQDCQWSTVVKNRGPRRSARRRQPSKPAQLPPSSSVETVGSNATTHHPRTSQRPTRRPKRGDVGNQERVAVPGTRRVWGTLKHTPTTAIVASLKKLTTLGDRLSVKRKFR